MLRVSSDISVMDVLFDEEVVHFIRSGMANGFAG